MASFYIIIPIALGFFAIGASVFFWAVNSNQFENLDGEANRILFDDEFNESD